MAIGQTWINAMVFKAFDATGKLLGQFEMPKEERINIKKELRNGRLHKTDSRVRRSPRRQSG